MKLLSILFFIIVVLGVLKYYNLVELNNWTFAGLAFLWVIIFYLKIHFKNKEKKRPQAVYFAPPK